MILVVAADEQHRRDLPEGQAHTFGERRRRIEQAEEVTLGGMLLPEAAAGPVEPLQRRVRAQISDLDHGIEPDPATILQQYRGTQRVPHTTVDITHKSDLHRLSTFRKEPFGHGSAPVERRNDAVSTTGPGPVPHIPALHRRLDDRAGASFAPIRKISQVGRCLRRAAAAPAGQGEKRQVARTAGLRGAVRRVLRPAREE
ncbi:hypothetical protein GCM10022419_129540 [Nonomuraea rosea]|uniref:Uncharacterized protein n=1 Tax=Nonomuraea rosea TaxID=638574 RepID=A0ABP6ZX49_9ACTN